MSMSLVIACGSRMATAILKLSVWGNLKFSLLQHMQTLFYNVAENRNDKYVKNNTKFESRGGFKKMSKQLNEKSTPYYIQ